MTNVTESADLAALFENLPTAAVSDALDRAGLPGSLLGIGPLQDRQRAVGPAFTVQYVPVAETGATVGDFLDDVPAGGIVVIDNGGRLDATVWGGIMTGVAAARGVAGTVINGVCRDTAEAFELGYPMFSCGRFMRTGKDRVQLASVQEPVVIDGVTITPGDIVIGDSDGVVVVPIGVAKQIAKTASEIEHTEAGIVQAVRAGNTLRESRATFGYHRLQTKQN